MAADLAKELGLVGSLMNSFSGSDAGDVKIRGTVLLQKKNTLDFNSPLAEIGDNLSELVGQNIKMAIVSSTHKASGSVEGKRSKTTHMDEWLETDEGRILVSDEGVSYPVVFSVDKGFGPPGALLVESHHPEEFFLKSVTLALPSGSPNPLHFVCNSWVDNHRHYRGPRIFFSNQPYLPSQTPLGLQGLRTVELMNLRGDNVEPGGEREEYDRIYDYDVYNDLGNPDENDEDLARPVLGGSKEYPYPRRCRTGRKATKKDPKSESPVSLLGDVYVPRDEQFGHIKESDFLGVSLKSFAHFLVPLLEDLFKDEDFASMDEISDLYVSGVNLSACKERTEQESEARYKDPLELIRELTSNEDDPSILKFPRPDIIKIKQRAFVPDDEFARETLSGLNPMTIERLKAFPPKSSLDASKYGPQTSSITEEHITQYLEGLSVDEAVEQKRLYIVDYHDVYLPYLERINALAGKGYASRSLFFLRGDGTLKPIAIELTLPPISSSGKSSSEAKRGRAGSYHRVFTPTMANRVEWDMAKAHAVINDAGVHQLVSHWLRTHCALEPFIIAAYRNLSALHPLHVLLKPHFKNTMNINGLARKALINCNSKNVLIGGIIEKSFTPTKYSMEMSSVVYKTWRFDGQAFPKDLIKRGMAEEDAKTKQLRLTVEDYPFAVDGLEIWAAVEEWVGDYVAYYYKDDAAVRDDVELQAWWKEVREVGHGDKKGESWWAAMRTPGELKETLTTLIWLASAHHAAVNFGQYAYAGYMPNKPTMARLHIPEPGSQAYQDMTRDPEAFLLRMVSTKSQATIVMATLEILSTHSSDESYLGRRSSPDWTADTPVLDAFDRFGRRLAAVEARIFSRNGNPALKNRSGAVQIPYTLLVPSSDEGLSGRGIPNSTSI